MAIRFGGSQQPTEAPARVSTPKRGNDSVTSQTPPSEPRNVTRNVTLTADQKRIRELETVVAVLEAEVAVLRAEIVSQSRAGYMREYRKRKKA